MRDTPRFKVVAHRGDRTRYPENTLIGLESALKKGVPYIEFDLQMNTDGELFLLHDSNLKNTAGVDASILTMSTEDIKEISVHEPKRFQDDFHPTPIPTFDDVLALIKQYPETKALVEIKTASLKHWGLEKVMDLLLFKLKDFPDQCVLISFNKAAVAYTQKHSELKVGWILSKYNEAYLKKAKELNPEYLICNKTKVPHDKPVLQGDWDWMLYGIHTYEEAIHYSMLGSPLMETDDICALLQLARAESK